MNNSISKFRPLLGGLALALCSLVGASCDEVATTASHADVSEPTGALEAGDLGPAPSADASEAPTSGSDIDEPEPEDASGSAGTEDVAGAVDVDQGPTAGALGSPCTTSDTCFSGWCMPSEDGMVCSKGCLDSCPDGWSCQSIIGPSGAPTFVCVQPTVLLCQPCVAHKDCNQAIAAGTNLCVEGGDEGSFCGLACEDDEGCPEGYVCEPVPSPGGGTSSQCLPADGAVCGCSIIGVQLGLETGCALTNALGSCSGARGCAVDGLTACDAPEAVVEVCNGVDDDCNGDVDDGLGGEVCEVAGGTGTCPGTEVCSQGQMMCQGSPPIDEICNGVDDDCDGALDEGFEDSEGDGIPDCSDLDDDDDGVEDDFDCEPHNAAVSPEVAERCNGIDDNCDGEIDEKNAEDCQVFWQDIDADGHGSIAAPSRCLCSEDLNIFYTVLDSPDEPSDCADLYPQVNPGGVEVCDGVDDDCDQSVDEGFPDADGDNKPDCTDGDDDGDGTNDNQDCAPKDPTIHNNAQELCNGIDDNCNGLTDELGATGCMPYYLDSDSDGQGTDTVPPTCLCYPDPATLYTAFGWGDCDDLSATTYVGAIEACNGVDDDCDGFTDEWLPDYDLDGDADCVDDDDDDDGVLDSADCAPYDSTITPGAVEVCNGKDDNCDDGADEAGSLGCFEYFLDVDGDGKGKEGYPSACLCDANPLTHYTAEEGGDCNDANPAVFLGATEVCNFLDDDCDGLIDEAVASPCGDCSAVCILQIGAEGFIAFELPPGEGSGVVLTADGGLTLSATPGEGVYTHVVTGWLSAPTLWDRVWLEVEVPSSGASVALRYRTAETSDALGDAAWSGSFGPFTTGLLPVQIEQVAMVLELELTLTSTNPNANPVLRDVSFITWKQQ